MKQLQEHQRWCLSQSIFWVDDTLLLVNHTLPKNYWPLVETSLDRNSLVQKVKYPDQSVLVPYDKAMPT